MDKIKKNIDIVILYQTTRHISTGDRILEELSKLNIAPPAPSRSFGVCLGRAPQIAEDAFVGRIHELQQLHHWLSPQGQPSRQRIVSIVGTGGVGKTQLSLAHVRECADKYSSVFWVDAKDETCLRRSMAHMSAVVFGEFTSLAAKSADDEKLKIDKIRRWLSETGNNQWLLIFDNYDSPLLPGMRNSSGYDIRVYFPYKSHGSILITTRSPQLVFAKQLNLKRMNDIKQALAILAARSGRMVDGGKTILNCEG